MKVLKIILISLTLGIISSGCVKEQPVPDLPPSQSFVLEIDNIWKTSPAPIENSGILSKSNFVFAAATIYWWNTVLTVQMVVPFAAFVESFNHEPIWDKTAQSWVWSYSIDIHNTTYTAELFAETVTDKVNWTMYVSKTDGYTDFLWFTGTSQTDNSSGSWTINNDPDSSNKDDGSIIPFLYIQWNINDDGTSEITYTIIEEESADNGNYIKYGIIDDPDLNAFYDIFRIWEDNVVSIKWNTTLHYGRILSMLHFQDPYWHCWNESQENIACE